MKHLKKYIAILSLIPFGALQYLLMVLPMVLCRQLKYLGRTRGVPTFDATGRFEKWMRDDRWNGFAGIHIIVILDNPMDKPKYNRTLMHEWMHTQQILRNGALQLLLYPAESVKVFFFGDKEKEHAYYSNKYEVEARLAAGQDEYIDPKYWMDGPEDRWHWW